MPKYFPILLIAGILSTASLGFAQQTTPKIKEVPIQPTSAASGQQMYATYCAVCHGTDGRGGGPASLALKTAPPDLTALSQKNGGIYPADHVASVLKFGAPAPAHGTAEMPIWSDLMLSLHSDNPKSTMLVQQRVRNLTDYLKQIQR